MTAIRMVFVFLTIARGLAAQVAGANGGDWLLPNLALRLSLEVSNPVDTPIRALATVPVSRARAVAPDFPGRLAIVVLLNPPGSPMPGTAIASQSDDLDGDGTPDQFEFPVVLAPGERRRVDIYYSTTLDDTISWPKRVQAKHGYGYNREVAALESELIGYRTYGGFFLDVMARMAGRPGLNNDAAGYVPIGRDLGMGRDVFHVGDSLGLGGIFLRQNRKLYQPPMNVPTYAHRPSPEIVPHYRVISQGPVRAIVETALNNWNLDGDLIDMRARYSIDQGEPFVRCEFEIVPVRIAPGHEYEVGSGLRDLPVESLVPAIGRLIVVGKQNERDGVIGLGLYYDPAVFSLTASVRTAESMNQVVISKTRVAPGQTMAGEYAVAAAWKGSGIDDPARYLTELSAAVAARVQTSNFVFSRTPRPEKVDAEAQ